jgi:PPOX class probable FMN-dependent enzyme
VTSIEQLESLYAATNPNALMKETGFITPEYRRLIEAAPFAALATIGPEGMDCSPRGDLPSSVHVVDDRTLHIPDRRGNNRLDSLRNIVLDGRVALLLLIPGLTECMRVNGRAVLRFDEPTRARYPMREQLPTTVIEITTEAVYFQCARAVKRADLWNPDRRQSSESLPTPGQIMSAVTDGAFDGQAYDDQLEVRQEQTLY